MAKQRRVFRVAERVQELIANELLRLADPRLSLVTITKVVTSSDLRHCKVYWVTSGDKKRLEQVEEAFEGARGLFRKLVGKELGIRFVPELRFYYDDTLETWSEVDRLLQRVREERPAGSSFEPEEK